MGIMRDINFFSSYIRHSEKIKKRVSYIVLFSFVFISILSLTYYYYIVMTSELNTKIAKNQMFLSLKENKQKLDEIENLKYRIDVLRNYTNTSDKIKLEIEKLNIINSSLLKDISTSIPKEITLGEINIDTEEIYFYGFSNDKISIAQFEYNLKKVFDYVFVYSISKEDSIYYFDGYCKLKGDNNETY